MSDYYPFWPFKFKRPAPTPSTPPVALPKPPASDPDITVPAEPTPNAPSAPTTTPYIPRPRPKPQAGLPVDVRRHFYNEPGFQTYGSFFAFWDGFITAGHVLSEASGLLPPFASHATHNWPGGLDAALLDCRLPDAAPDAPYPGQAVTMIGFPGGSSVASTREGKVYIRRSDLSFIAHIITPDEPVVTGMSGGVVLDTLTQTPIGIIITRNSPADLNADRDPDESCDFTALSDVWQAAKNAALTS